MARAARRRRPSRKSKGKKAEVAAAEGGEGEPPPPPKKKKKKKTRMEGEGDVVEEEGPEVIPPTFEFQVGPRLISRNLSYHQDASTPGLRSYALFPGPAIFASLVWYPIGPFTDGPAKNIGFEGAIEQAFFVSSSLPPDERHAQARSSARRSTSSRAAARYRMPFGAGHYFWGALTGGEHAFTFNEHGDRRPRGRWTSPTRSTASSARASASTSSCCRPCCRSR